MGQMITPAQELGIPVEQGLGLTSLFERPLCYCIVSPLLQKKIYIPSTYIIRTKYTQNLHFFRIRLHYTALWQFIETVKYEFHFPQATESPNRHLKCALIFKKCLHLQYVLSFIKCAFIFKMRFHFQNVLSFSKCSLS